MHVCRFGLIVLMAIASGCGMTRWSDTPRTATEQLLLSDAVDRAVSRLDCNLIAGRTVYLDTSPVKQTIDSPYLISTVRQHLMASDCVVKDKPDDAEFVVELRAGAVGTDRHELLFGVPATTLPSATPGGGAQIIPELPLAKRTDQRAVAKVALFVYDRQTGKPVWQSGTVPIESKARDLWVFGAGPFQRGNIYQGTKFAGHNVPAIMDVSKAPPGKRDSLPVTNEAIFNDPHELTAQRELAPPVFPPTTGQTPVPPAGPLAPAVPAVGPAGPAGPSGMSSGLSMQNTQTPLQAAPVSGMSSGFSPQLMTRLPDVKLPWSHNTATTTESTTVK